MKKSLFLLVFLSLLFTLAFVQCSKDDEPVLFSLTTAVSPEGSGTVSPASGMFDEGETLTITATPTQGFSFLEWSGDASGNTTPLQLTMTKNMSLTARFLMEPQDADGDGVGDDTDQCPDTPAGETVDAEGCGDSQKDTDGDGVTNDTDQCPDTPEGEEVDEDGCPLLQAKTYVPDDDFEQFLIDQGYDTVLNDSVYTSAIETIIAIDIPNAGDFDKYEIKDFTGIEGFTSLEFLGIFYQNFTGDALDLSQNTNLRSLTIGCSFVDNLDLSQTTIESLSISGFSVAFALCDNKMSNLDLSGVPTLKTLNISEAVFDDLNATLKSAISVEQLSISGTLNDSGPVDYVDLSANSNLKTVSFWAVYNRGPNLINLKNGANQQLLSLTLDVCVSSEYPDVANWKPCIEADDPAFIESIIRSAWCGLPSYTVTTDCGN